MFAFLALLLVAGCRPPENGSPAAKPVLRIGTSADYRPFSWQPEPGTAGSEPELRGFSADLARSYAAATGRRVEWVRFRWRDLERDLAAGRFDLALSGVTVRADRSVAGRFSVPVTLSGLVVLVRASGPLGGPADLRRPGLRLAVNAGGHLERTARRLFEPGARIQPVAENADVLARIEDPAVDGVVTDSVEAPHWRARRPGLRPIGPLTRDRKAAWFPIARSTERARFDRWLLAAERDGSLARLRRAHALPDVATATPVAALLASIDERLSLMPGVADAKARLDRPIEDLAREQRVLEAAVAAIARACDRRGVPAIEPEPVRAFYRAQIEAAKTIQQSQIEAARTIQHGAHPDRRDGGPGTRAAALRDLDERIRPALLDLGDRIADLVVSAATHGERPPDRAEVADALARHALPDAELEAIHTSLAGLLAPTR